MKARSKKAKANAMTISIHDLLLNLGKTRLVSGAAWMGRDRNFLLFQTCPVVEPIQEQILATNRGVECP
jgi:hypothetical protein